MSTDTDFVIAQLRQGPQSTNDLLRASFAERGVGCTVHSRIADARRVLATTGETITCQREGTTAAGRGNYVYEIVSLVPTGQLTLDAALSA